MPTFAAMNSDNLVDNIVLAESLEYAQEHTQLSCIEVTTETRFPSIGWNFYDGVFRSPKPSEDHTVSLRVSRRLLRLVISSSSKSMAVRFLLDWSVIDS